MKISSFPSPDRVLSETAAFLKFELLDFRSPATALELLASSVLFALIPFGLVLFDAMLHQGTTATVGGIVPKMMRIAFVGQNSEISSCFSADRGYIATRSDKEAAISLLGQSKVDAVLEIPNSDLLPASNGVDSVPTVNIYTVAGMSDAFLWKLSLDLQRLSRRMEDEKLRLLGIANLLDGVQYKFVRKVSGSTGVVTPMLRTPLAFSLVLLVCSLSSLFAQGALHEKNLESLLVLPVRRLSYIISTILLSVLVHLATIPPFMLAFFLLLRYFPDRHLSFLVLTAPVRTLALAVVVCIPQIVMFSAFSLCVAAFQRNREDKMAAVSVLLPVVMNAGLWLAPGVYPAFAAWVPMSSFGLSLEQVLSGDCNYTFLMISSCSSFVYAIPACLLTEKFLERE